MTEDFWLTLQLRWDLYRAKQLELELIHVFNAKNVDSVCQENNEVVRNFFKDEGKPLVIAQKAGFIYGAPRITRQKIRS